MQGTDLLMLCFKANRYFYMTLILHNLQVHVYTKFIHNWVLISIQECGRPSTYIYENNEKLHLHILFIYSSIFHWWNFPFSFVIAWLKVKYIPIITNYILVYVHISDNQNKLRQINELKESKGGNFDLNDLSMTLTSDLDHSLDQIWYNVQYIQLKNWVFNVLRLRRKKLNLF